jgi:hypothetical protein
LPIPPCLARPRRHAFYAIATWDSHEGANAFYLNWDIADEPGEEAIFVEGDIGLVPEA